MTRLIDKSLSHVSMFAIHINVEYENTLPLSKFDVGYNGPLNNKNMSVCKYFEVKYFCILYCCMQ